MDTRRIKISKLEAARRQLDTAIRLYFTDGDPISMHTLAAASFEILKDLDKHGPNTGTFYDSIENVVRPGLEKQAIIAMREAQNFLKHAEQEPDKVLDFWLGYPEMLLGVACDKYRELAAEESAEMIVFALWFGIQNPNVLRTEIAERLRQIPLARTYAPSERRQFFADFIEAASLSVVNLRASRNAGS
ncbi:MAG TPA: hypothetical protein VN857_18210 [Chthoniobacterales bacterium]|jgi:hypothetical protein|nr:hypothetical protein [Chthoniobacterales bacterium]